MRRGGLSRRRFLQLAGLVGLSVPALQMHVAEARATQGQVRTGVWAQGGAGFRLGRRRGLEVLDEALVAQAATGRGWYLSPVHEAQFSFNAVALTWSAEPSREDSPAFFLRTSGDGNRWNPWQPVHALDQYRDATQASAILDASGRFLQYQASLDPGPLGEASRLSEVNVVYLDSAPGSAALVPFGPTAPQEASAGVARPNIIGRAGWGANESYRFRQGKEVWPVERPPVKKIILHHTVTSNGASDPAAVLRAIYHYHAVTLGWGDIGYNYIVDRNGNVYEGRFGGEGVRGAHAAQFNEGTIGVAILGNYQSERAPDPLLQGLASLLSWLCARHQIQPQGRSVYNGRDLPNILSHREVSYTTCPGALFTEQLPQVRARLAGIPDSPYRVSWGQHATPFSLDPGQRREVELTLRNAGSGPWDPATGKFAYRLGYHWYDQQGKPAAQPPSEDLRTYLPKVLAPGEEAKIKAALAAPQAKGQFTLAWDMVREGTTWFANAGGDPLEVAVQVGAVQYGVAWGRHQTPEQLHAGQNLTVRIETQNLGRQTWTNTWPNPFRVGYQWYDASGRLVGQPPEDDRRTDLPREVAPGDRIAVDAALVAPRKPGRYKLTWDIVHEGVTWFAVEKANRPLSVEIQVGAVQYGVAWTRHQVPEQIKAGQFTTVSIGMQNLGKKTWTNGWPNPFRLGYHWYDAGGRLIGQPREDDRRTGLPREVAPGESIAIDAALVAPRTPGRYTLSWDLVHEGVTWFAAEKANHPLTVAITVV